MNLPRWALVTATLFFLTVGIVGAAGVESGYDLSMNTAVDVPERTVENPEDDSQEYTITQVGRSSQGDNAAVDISPTSDNRYSAFFRNQDRQTIDSSGRISGDQQVEFNIANEPAGSYVVTVGETSEPETVLPVVIEAYTVDTLELGEEQLDGATITADGTHTVAVELTAQTDRSIADVTLTLWTETDGVVHEVALEQTDNDTTVYEGSLSNLNVGDYNAQVRIRGGETVDGEPELIGLSGNSALTVESNSGDSDDGTDGGSSNDGSGTGDETQAGEDGTGDDSETNSDEGGDSTSNNTSGNTTNGTASDTSDATSNTGENGESTDSESPNDPDDSPDSDGVIEPNTNSRDSDSEDRTPLNVLPVLLALVVVTAAVQRIRP